VRACLVTLAALAGLVAGCTEFAFVLRPPPQFVGVTTWTEVPEGQQDVKAKVGDVLHLPLGPTWGARGGLPFLYTVTVNDEAPQHPVYCTSAARTSFVFDARKAGEYQVESHNGLSEKSYRVWHIRVVE
jgi:hypothetical protein